MLRVHEVLRCGRVKSTVTAFRTGLQRAEQSCRVLYLSAVLVHWLNQRFNNESLQVVRSFQGKFHPYIYTGYPKNVRT